MRQEIENELYSIVQKLYPCNYSVSGQPSTDAIRSFSDLLPFLVHSYPSGQALRGWVIPHGWSVSKALIKHEGNVIYDCISDSPLGCAYLSPSFHGTVDKATLLAHSSYRLDLPHAIVYDWTRLYRPASTNWGLSIPWSVLSSLPDENIEIDLSTTTYPSSMNVLEFHIAGLSSREIIINAHNCHPYQANDDISGCAVAIKLFQYLSGLQNLKYSYRLIIAPELFGPMFWLEQYKHLVNRFAGCFLLKSVGNDSPLKLQSSFHSSSDANKALEKAALDFLDESPAIYPYRTYYGNDETVFEAPGNCIPTVTMTRFPFEEYHTNLDTPSIISPSRLSETFFVLLKAINILETNFELVRPPDGLFCLSHPDYDLYKSAPEPGISDAGTDKVSRRWNLLMNTLPRHCCTGITVLDAAIKYDLPYDSVHEYLTRWAERGLAETSFSSI